MGIRILGLISIGLFAGTLFPVNCFGQSVEGAWHGNLELAPGQSLPLGFTVGSIQSKSATMDSPAQGAFDIPCEVQYISNDSLCLEVKQIGMTYAAKLQGDIMKGTLKQMGYSFPLDLNRGAIKLNRPQTPQPPYEYKTEEVVFENKDADVKLAGTLTLPRGFSSSTPIAMMVSGSGLQNRDEEIFRHKPFAVIADYLAKNGIASLRYDDRGFGESTGNGSEATTNDFAGDANAAVDYLKKRFHGNPIGVVGHSEGGQIAFKLAGDKQFAGNPDFIVTIGAPAVRGDSLLAEQSVIMLKAGGMDSMVCNDYRNAVLKLYRTMMANGVDAAKKEVPTICAGWDFLPQYANLKANIVAITEHMNPWMLYSIGYSAENDMRNAKCPALALYGAKDTQVPSELNAPKVSQINPAIQVEVCPGLNHLMQHCNTGAVTEYGRIEETIAPEVLERIARFINTANK